jgi:hypothetical protein
MLLPRYPVYIPSKGRYERCLTARFLTEDKCPFHIVVEPQEEDAYRQRFPQASILVLPFANLGQGSIPARNWIKAHATEAGHKRHWQIDDNCSHIKRIWEGRRIPCRSGVALAATEDFVDRYENVAVAGLNYEMFAVPNAKMPPFRVNCHVYSCTLTLNETPHQWRGRYNEDTDYCLQVLADGWCTVLMNTFIIWKAGTMTVTGGNTDQLYQGDGRLKMARSLERMWPGVVETKRRFGRPQHVVNWKKFRNPLKRRTDIDWEALENAGSNDYGMVLKRVK